MLANQLAANFKTKEVIRVDSKVNKIIKLKSPSVFIDQAAADLAIGIETIKAKLTKIISTSCNNII